MQMLVVGLGKPVSWIMISPSVTPRKSNTGSNNPALRLYKFETDTGQVSLFASYQVECWLVYYKFKYSDCCKGNESVGGLICYVYAHTDFYKIGFKFE